jgi:hypothetical protein
MNYQRLPDGRWAFEETLEQERRREQERERKCAERLKEAHPIACAVSEALQDIAGVVIRVTPVYIEVRKSVSLFSEGTEILRALGQIGWHQDGVYEVPMDRQKWWSLKTDNDEIVHAWVCVTLTLLSEGAACEFVQVGTETKEVPIYKLICDEVEPAACTNSEAR